MSSNNLNNEQFQKPDPNPSSGSRKLPQRLQNPLQQNGTEQKPLFGSSTAPNQSTIQTDSSPKSLSFNDTIGKMSPPELTPQTIKQLQEAGYTFKFNLSVSPPPNATSIKAGLPEEAKKALNSIQEQKIEFNVNFKPSKPRALFGTEDRLPNSPLSNEKQNIQDTLSGRDRGLELSEYVLENYRIEFKTSLQAPVQTLQVGTQDSNIQNKLIPVDEASKRLGISERQLRRIATQTSVKSEHRQELVGLQRLYVDLDDVIRYRQEHPVGKNLNKQKNQLE